MKYERGWSAWFCGVCLLSGLASGGLWFVLGLMGGEAWKLS